MKKVVVGILMLLLAGVSLFGQEKKEFNGKNYSLDYSFEFEKPFEEELAHHHYWKVQDWQTNDEWFHIRQKKNIDVQYNLPKYCYIEDGILHMIEQHWKEDGQYFVRDGEIYARNALWFGIDYFKQPKTGNFGLYEFKFKMPKDSGTSFAMFLVPEKDQEDKAYPENVNSKGMCVREIDFAEIKTKGKTIEPMGGFHTQNKDGVYYKGYHGKEPTEKRIKVDDEWYNNWHIMQVILEPTSMKIYYDGELFRTVVLDKDFGEITGNYSLIFRPEYCDTYDQFSKLNWKDEEKHDFQVDYVRYYREVK